VASDRKRSLVIGILVKREGASGDWLDHSIAAGPERSRGKTDRCANRLVVGQPIVPVNQGPPCSKGG